MFPFLQRNYFQIPQPDPYILFNQVQNFSRTSRQEFARAIETAGKLLKGSNSYLAIDGKWAEENPQLNAFLEQLMGGHTIFVTKDLFERLTHERTLSEKASAWWKQTVHPWGKLEGVETAGVVNFGAKYANKLGSLSARISSSLAQPALAIYETVDILKDVIYHLHQKNWIVVNDDNYLRVIATFACMKEHAQKNFMESMEATLLGPQYFWKKWQERGRSQPLFWQPKEQAVRQKFLDDLRLSRATKQPVGWVSEMRGELMQTFNPQAQVLGKLPERDRELLSKEISGFSKMAEWSYGMGYHAFVENDEKTRKKLFAYWEYLLREYVGAHNPKLVVTHMNGAAYAEAQAELEKMHRNLMVYAAAGVGITALFFLWDYPFSPLVALPLRLATYGIQELFL